MAQSDYYRKNVTAVVNILEDFAIACIALTDKYSPNPYVWS